MLPPILKDLQKKYNLGSIVFYEPNKWAILKTDISYFDLARNNMILYDALEKQILTVLNGRSVTKNNPVLIMSDLFELGHKPGYELRTCFKLPPTKIQQRFYGHIYN